MERIIDFGRTHKGEVLAETPEKYLKWLASHESNLLPENRWASKLARKLLERRAIAEVAKVAPQQVEKTIQPISSPTEDRMMKAALTSNRGFRLMR